MPPLTALPTLWFAAATGGWRSKTGLSKRQRLHSARCPGLLMWQLGQVQFQSPGGAPGSRAAPDACRTGATGGTSRCKSGTCWAGGRVTETKEKAKVGSAAATGLPRGKRCICVAPCLQAVADGADQSTAAALSPTATASR